MADNQNQINQATDDRVTKSNSRAGSGWNIAFGIWLIIAPFILGYGAFMAPTSNDIVIGIIVLALAIIGAAATRLRWSRTINVIAGIWLFFSPFILGFAVTQTAALWNDLILGALVIIFAGWSLGTANRYHQRHALQH